MKVNSSWFKKGHKSLLTESSKIKISNFQKGRIKSKETREKLSIAHKGKKLTEECKIKISLAKKGMKHTHEAKRKIKKNHKGMLGKKHSEISKAKISNAVKGEKSAHWKGDNISKIMVHKRIQLKYGKPNYCEICKRTDRKRYDWSNKDHKYSLNKQDWQRLCRKCHIKYDVEHNNYKKNSF